MLTAPELYPFVLLWLQSLNAIPHAAARAAIAELVTALLVQHSLVPTALMRALLSAPGTPARQRFRRLTRAWCRPWLAPAALAAGLVHAVLTLRTLRPADRVVHLALDGLRCGPWEILVLGIVWDSRIVPVQWAVLPVPLPRGQFTPTVVRLIRAAAAVWPATQAAHLVADREFPSRALFEALQAAGWGWTVRLRASSWILLDGQGQRVRPLLAGAPDQGWSQRPAAWGGAATPLGGTLAIGRGLLVVPRHQTGPASLAIRARQWGRRQQHVRSRHGARRPADASVETDTWMVLFTSHPEWLAAVRSYRQRWAIESTFRDVQSGWDGQQGWQLEAVAAAARQAQHVETLTGLWAVGLLLQLWIGQHTLTAPRHEAVGQVIASWTTTGRLSLWARGHLALNDPTGVLRPWLRQTLWTGAARLDIAWGAEPPVTLPRAA
jgi:DDE family transposase